MSGSTDRQHQANQAFWDASTAWWQEKEDARGHWRAAHRDPSLVLSPTELGYLRHLDGKKVCVLGSGDNEVAFALAGLGAQVTSVDISERRLAVAAERAATLGLHLTFQQADVTDLGNLSSGTFDVVYTGGHMSVWIADIGRYYAEAVRVLLQDGLFIVNDYHPIRRMWLDAEGSEPRHRYFDRGPYRYTTDEGLPTYEYHWTVADHVQALLDGGCRLVTMEEQDQTVEDEFWMQVQLDKLPAYLLLVGRKERTR